jgi:hypothetical protein
VGNWINKLLGGTSTDQAAAPSAGWTEHLKGVLAPLEKAQDCAGLAQDALAYILTGEPLSALHAVAQRRAAGAALRIIGFPPADDGGARLALYAAFEQIPSAVALRWARLLEASAASAARDFKLQVPGGKHWPEALMMHAVGLALNVWSSEKPPAGKVPIQAMERMLVEDGMEPSAVLVSAFTTPIDSGYGVERRLRMVSELPGYAEALLRHLETLRPLLLSNTAVTQRTHVLRMLSPLPREGLDRVAGELVEFATCGSKQVRAAAEPLILSCGDAVIPALKDKARQGDPDERVNALRWLWRLGKAHADSSLQDFAQEAARSDKAPTAQALIHEWELAADAESAPEARYDYAVPTVEWAVALTPAVDSLLKHLWERLNQSVEQANRQMRAWHEQMKAQGRNVPFHELGAFTSSELEALRSYIGSGEAECVSPVRSDKSAWRHSQAVQAISGAEGMTPVLLLKILAGLNLAFDNHGVLNAPATMAIGALHKASGRPTLLELSVMLEGMGRSATSLFSTYCRRWSSFASDWSDEAVWPFFARHLETLLQRLSSTYGQDYWTDRAALFRAVATLPTTPPSVVNALFDLALGTAKGDRALAQAALANHVGKEVRIIDALSDGRAEVRSGAARWLARLRYEGAIPALEAAVTKEKNDIAKGALLDALEMLGRPVERYLDREALRIDATKALAKGLPKDVQWFPWTSVREVRWADNLEQIPPDTVKWLMVQAVKQKSPEPNAVLRKFCSMFEPRDREALGQFVLETWLREDVRPIPPEEARKRAVSQAQTLHGYMQRSPQHFQDSPHFGRSVDELTAFYLPGLLRQPAGSAIASKGLLAIAAACGRERIAAPVARYLKEYYGTRAAQGRALIAMLAWVDHPSATQLMLSVGNRFRTKSFQQEATKQAEALAERNNWTLGELADRTIPSAGFDEAGEMELSYGDRRFVAKLLPDFKVELINPEGKKIASLPEPRQDEDAERAKEAKKAYSATKKEIKTIVALQTDRLYEALCTERDWPFSDWSQYLNRHPIVRRLVQRLVWVELRDGQVVQAFRPLDDGTLTDCEDNEVSVSPEARVRIAHDTLLTPAAIAQWQQHLLDYEVTPLFQQLGKGSYVLPEDKGAETAVKDFEGHMLESYALRGRALKLGYTRGAGEDGGWFYVYEKRFPTLGLQALIEFTGSPLPEEKRDVALIKLLFTSAESSGWQRQGMPLSKVPKILLSECYNDLRLIAAEGRGYDPEWEKKGSP